MEYDVFISCKSEDYIYAEEIYDFLTENGINTFLASRELRNLGDSEYRRAISKAMKSTYHMIVFASDPSYIDSTWVYYEWDMYVNAMLKGFKNGQIVTILKDIKVDDINMDLWKYESFNYDSYKKKILSYVETPASIARLAEVKKKKKEAEDKEQEELASNIRLSISVLNNTEDQAKILREQISLQIQQIKDNERKTGLIESLDQAGPLHLEIHNLLQKNMDCETSIAELQVNIKTQIEKIKQRERKIQQLESEINNIRHTFRKNESEYNYSSSYHNSMVQKSPSFQSLNNNKKKISPLVIILALIALITSIILIIAYLKANWII